MGISYITITKNLSGGPQQGSSYELRKFPAMTEATRTHLAVIRGLVVLWETTPTGRKYPPEFAPALKPRANRSVGPRNFSGLHCVGSITSTANGPRLQVGKRRPLKPPPGAAVVAFSHPISGSPEELIDMVLDEAPPLVTPPHLLP